jgi:hypothetical protein
LHGEDIHSGIYHGMEKIFAIYKFDEHAQQHLPPHNKRHLKPHGKDITASQVIHGKHYAKLHGEDIRHHCHRKNYPWQGLHKTVRQGYLTPHCKNYTTQ